MQDGMGMGMGWNKARVDSWVHALKTEDGHGEWVLWNARSLRGVGSTFIQLQSHLTVRRSNTGRIEALPSTTGTVWSAI